MELIKCNKHEEMEIVLSCQHVANAYREDVYYVPAEDKEEATIWCHNCEEARIKDKGWFDYADSIANWKIICSSCLDEIVKESNNCYSLEGKRTTDE